MCLRNTHLSTIFSEPTVVAPTGFLSRLLTLSYIRATLSKLDRFQNLAEAAKVSDPILLCFSKFDIGAEGR